MEGLKKEVCDYWNEQVCGSQTTDKAKYSKEYFDEIENHRYLVESEILSFAQFANFSGKKVLEVGIGAGTDFTQWVRAGAKAYGIDLTSEAIEHVNRRLAIYGLKAEEVRVADCEALPYESNSFDLVYSWGVIHHTPNTQKALGEIIRVTRSGATCKIMIYNRHSLYAFYLWARKALLMGRPWKSFSWCIYNFMESTGTKAFTKKEVALMLASLPVEGIRIQPVLTYYDKLGMYNSFIRFAAKVLSILFGGDRAGWFMTIQFNKKQKADICQ